MHMHMQMSRDGLTVRATSTVSGGDSILGCPWWRARVGGESVISARI